jgi:hypothetical protein
MLRFGWSCFICFCFFVILLSYVPNKKSKAKCKRRCNALGLYIFGLSVDL